MKRFSIGVVSIISFYFLILISGISGCCTVEFSQESIDRTSRIQAVTLALVDNSKSDYGTQEKNINNLRDEFTKSINDEKIRETSCKNNKETIKQWKILSGLMENFYTTWRKEGKLSQTFITEFKSKLVIAFNEIILLEKHKNKS